MRNPEIWLALIILGFLLFGAKKMPDAARGLGRSLRIFKAEMKGMGEDEQAQQAPQPAQPQAQAQPAAPAQLTAPAPVISAPPAAPVGAQQPVAPVGAQQPPAQQPESH